MTSSESYIFLAVSAALALVALIYLLSPKMTLLDDISTRGAEIRTRLHELLLRHKYDGNTKNMVLAAYVDIALEHHKAIWQLHKSGLIGSALAMVRLVWDPYLRALWINKVATAEEIEQASRDDLRFPKMSKMREDIRIHIRPSQRAVSHVLHALLALGFAPRLLVVRCRATRSIGASCARLLHREKSRNQRLSARCSG